MFFKTVVIGIGESGSGRDALAAAKLLPQARRVLASVYPYSPTPGGGRHQEYADVVCQHALQMLDARRTASALEGAETRAIPDTSAAQGLKRLAEREAADLLILGSPGDGAVGHITLGDVSRGVLHGATCPVLVAPLGYSGTPEHPARIGLAYDGSADAERVLGFAAGLARASGAWLEIVQAIDLSHLPGTDARTDDETEALLAPAQERLDERVAALDVPASGHVVEGAVQTVLVALTRRSDLLVCGSRSWGPSSRISLGGAAERLMEQSTCPVLVVPRGVTVPGTARRPDEATGASAPAAYASRR